MAGNWIKARTDLHDQPEVIGIARRCELDVDATVGKLLRVWMWADGVTQDGAIPFVTAGHIDTITRVNGFAEAMIFVGWLTAGDQGISIPKFNVHNGYSAKARAQTNRRVSANRQKANADGTPVKQKCNAASVTDGAQKALPELERDNTSLAAQERSTPKRRTDDHATAIDFFCNSWREKYGERYPFNRGKDGSAVKWCLDQCQRDVEQFRKVVRRYLSDGDDFLVMDRHGLPMLRSQFRRYITRPLPSEPRGEYDDLVRQVQAGFKPPTVAELKALGEPCPA